MRFLEMRPGHKMFVKTHRSLTPLHLKFIFKQLLTDQEFPGKPGMTAIVIIVLGNALCCKADKTLKCATQLGFIVVLQLITKIYFLIKS